VSVWFPSTKRLGPAILDHPLLEHRDLQSPTWISGEGQIGVGGYRACDCTSNKARYLCFFSSSEITMPETIVQPITFQLEEVDFTFCFIPACPEGFLMGDGIGSGYPDEQPVHRVVIPTSFWMLQTPVTQKQFQLWTQTKDFESRFEIPHRNQFEGPSHPAESMTWYQASAFCEWLTIRLHEIHAFPVEVNEARLPYEAEWEYACRAGSATEFWSGDGAAAMAEIGWYAGNSGNHTHPVASRGKSNPWGLFDMHGNVWEWCQDRWDEHAYRRRWDGISSLETFELNEQYGDRNTEGNGLGERRTQRGGSYSYPAWWCRAACRYRGRAGDSYRNCGLRVCLVP